MRFSSSPRTWRQDSRSAKTPSPSTSPRRPPSSPQHGGRGRGKRPVPLLRGGKVREVYEVDAGTLLLVASDRVSAFDVVMREAVPHKGAVLTQMRGLWLARLRPALPHHGLTAERRL